MKVLYFKVGKPPKVQEVDGTSLAAMQKLVGGYIQTLYLADDETVLVCDEEGKVKGKPINIPLYDSEGEMYDVIVGDCFICGEGGEDFTSLTDEQVEKYKRMYQKVY